MSKIRGCCISIDVKGSENIREKELLVLEFEELLNEINKKYKSDLLIPFEFRRGDEVIGVILSFANGYRVYEDFNDFCNAKNLEMYVGVGLGSIDTGLHIKDLEKINGSAVVSAFRARDEFLKSKEFMKNYNWRSENKAQLFVYSNEDIPYSIINYQAFLIHEHFNQRTDIQKKAIVAKENNPQLTVHELGVIISYKKNHAQNFFSALKNAKYEEYKEMKNMLIDLLNYVEKNYRY